MSVSAPSDNVPELVVADLEWIVPKLYRLATDMRRYAAARKYGMPLPHTLERDILFGAADAGEALSRLSGIWPESPVPVLESENVSPDKCVEAGVSGVPACSGS